MFGDITGLHHVVAVEATPERTAGAQQVNGDIALGYPQNFGDQSPAACGLLRWCSTFRVCRLYSARRSFWVRAAHAK